MNDTDYRAVLTTAMARLSAIGNQRETLETEAAKLRQFVVATINMLPDAERETFLKAFDTINEGMKAKETSLKDATLKILRDAGSEQWLTAARVRDRLVTSGFDFSFYMSNPLASVSTTLRRLKPDEVETAETEAVAAYRFNFRAEETKNMEKAELKRRIAAGRLGPSKLPR
jgi:hypothetical protein